MGNGIVVEVEEKGRKKVYGPAHMKAEEREGRRGEDKIIIF